MSTLKVLRKARGLTLEALAKLTKLDARRLGELERGYRLPQPEEAQRLGQFGCQLPPMDAYLRPSEALPKGSRRPFELPVFSEEYWKKALSHREESLPRWFMLATECHSRFEADCWLDLADRGGQPRLASPLALGFGQHHLVDDQGEGLANRVRACLRLRQPPRTVLLFPQIKILTSRVQFQLDGLGLCIKEGRNFWFDFELDGDGHDPRRDWFRQRHLAMLEVRIRTNTWENLWDQVAKLQSSR